MEKQIIFLKLKNKIQLIEFLKEAKKSNLNVTILGAGSNTLFRDNGVKGAVVKLVQDFSYIEIIDENIIDVGATTLDRKVANFAKDNHLANLEFLSCIPGSIGGAITMNSGCYDNDISQILVSIKAIDKNNLSEVEIKNKDIKFFYRGTNLSEDLIIISAKFKGVVKKNMKSKKNNLILSKEKNKHNQVKLKLVAVHLKILVKEKSLDVN